MFTLFILVLLQDRHFRSFWLDMILLENKRRLDVIAKAEAK